MVNNIPVVPDLFRTAHELLDVFEPPKERAFMAFGSPHFLDTYELAA